MKLLDHLGRRGPIVMACSLAIIGLSSQPFIGTDGWAGLGQWVGGLGALGAAWVALDIAKKEASRENAREAERARVQGYYVKASHTQTNGDSVHLHVVNQGDQPIVNVEPLALHIHSEAGEVVVPCSVPDGRRDVLLREDFPWEPWISLSNDGDSDGTAELMRLANGRVEVEIAFEDVNRTRWRRIGSRPPFVDETRRP